LYRFSSSFCLHWFSFLMFFFFACFGFFLLDWIILDLV
jgi:cytochrome b561